MMEVSDGDDRGTDRTRAAGAGAHTQGAGTGRDAEGVCGEDRTGCLTDYFHEATDKEVGSFAESQSLVIPDKESFNSAVDSQRIRKQIALVLDSKVLELPVAKIVSVARREAPHVKIETEGRGDKRRIVIPPNRARLKQLLDLLLENYWGGYFTGEQFVANSKRTLNGSAQQPRRQAR
jgi:hypothetical protein